MDRLTKILSLKRAHGSSGEQLLIDTVLEPYGPTALYNTQNEVLAYLIDVPDAEKCGPVLFSCHIDTVHAAADTPENPVLFDPELKLYYKDDNTPLGADDGAGVWLMLELIDAGVPGAYIFHRGEERGGIGSSQLADEHTELLDEFKFAIAFDRRGTTSVITHQGRGRCCSDAFAQAMADQLNQGGLELRPDDTGIYTDTAEYIRRIPECTNVSVGYDCEHSGAEYLDVEYLLKLRAALIEHFDPAGLPVERDVNDVSKNFDLWGQAGRLSSPFDYTYDEPRDAYDIAEMHYQDIVRWVRDADPCDVADLLVAMSDDITFYDNQRAERAERLEVGLQ
jgi:acetylornithine deacetylase/succinyl-diaminopimelate desuccinylase-like protein